MNRATTFTVSSPAMSGAALVVVVDQPDWATRAEAWLTEPERFNREYVERDD